MEALFLSFNVMLVENELLLEAIALINYNEDQIAEIESDMTYATGCGMCGYGRS